MSCPGQEVKCPICAVSADKVSFHLATLLQLVKKTPGSYTIYFGVQLGVRESSPLLLAPRPSCSRLARSRLVAPPRFSFKAGHSAQKSRSRLLAPPRVSWSCSNSDVYLNSLAGHRGSCMSAALAGGGRRMTPLRCRYCSTTLVDAALRDQGLRSQCLRASHGDRGRRARVRTARMVQERCRRPCLYLPPRRCPDRACRRELLASRSTWLTGDPAGPCWST